MQFPDGLGYMNFLSEGVIRKDRDVVQGYCNISMKEIAH